MYSRRDIRAAWAVHVLTATGVVVGMFGLNSVTDGDARGAILWLVAAMVLDGIDGPIARKLDVRRRLPMIDGNALDLIVDYFTCTILPVAFLFRFSNLPNRTVGVTGVLIVYTGALWMARTEQETEDRWFRGFPAEWNVIIPTLYLLRANPWASLAVCAVLCVLSMTPHVLFPHPVSVRERRGISLAFMVAWLGSMVALAGMHPDSNGWLRLVLLLAPMWTLFQVVEQSIRRRREPIPVS